MNKKTLNYQRRILSLYGFLLPIMAPILGFIAYDKNAPDFWYSISATFYASSNILMIGCLSIFAFFLWTYKGYDIGDRVTCCFSSLMALGILIFPCNCSMAGKTTGIFDIPTEVSHLIHCVIAALLFSSFAYMIGYRFTKRSRDHILTKEKVMRNNIYRICSLIIMAGMISQMITSILDIKWFTIINETIMLWAFSVAWGIKSGIINFGDN